MSDKIRISELEILEDIADGDWVVVVDVSDLTQGPEGTTKRVRKDLLKGVNWQGSWVAGTYVSDDAVSHEGSSWVANTTTTEEPSLLATDWDVLAVKGDTGPEGPQGIQGIQGDQGDKGNQWQGPWVAGTYVADDVVEHDGSSWIATTTTTEEPSNFATDWDLFAAKGVDGAGAGDMLKVNYDPANKNTDVFDMDNMDEGTDTKILTAAERAKLAFIAITQSVDLDQMEANIAALANGMVYKGNWDASAGTFPGAGIAEIGWFYTVSVGGTVNGVVFVAGDRLIATVDNASTTTFAGNWTQVDATDAVQSVAGLVGVITALALRSAMNVGEIIDEDNMASNDATKVPSQQSVKAYVDGLAGVLNYQAITATGDWTKPAGLSGDELVFVRMWGGGGAGGSGSSNPGGGGGGAYAEGWFKASQFGATVACTIGAGGAAGAFNGASGGQTSFGAFLDAFGGGGGYQQTQTTGGGGGGGGGGRAVGAISSGTNAASGGGATGTAGVFGTGSANNVATGGFPGVGDVGGGAGGGNTTAGGPGGSAYYGGGGGGGGCGDGTGAGGAGGASIWGGGGGGGSSENTTGGAGGVSKNGGNGGAGVTAGTGTGTAGSVPGGGGGGGRSGGSTTGGAGARGEIRVWVIKN